MLCLIMVMAFLFIGCNLEGNGGDTTTAQQTKKNETAERVPDTTVAPKEETTEAPADTTTVPEDTTTVPSEETTVIPEDTKTVQPEDTTELPTDTTVAPSDDTTLPPSVEAEIPEDADYTGTTFKVLSRVSYDSTGWGNYDIVYDEENEFIVNEIKNAVNTRNQALYDRLGVSVEQIKGTATDAQNKLLAGTYKYDMLLIQTADAARLAQQGLLLHTGELEYMDTSKPYYDQTALEQLAIKGKNYYFYSDITVTNFDATWVYYFNHDMIDKYGLEKPYELLESGDWTLDKLISMAETATADPSSTSKTDDWGIAGHQDLIGSIYVGSGETIAKVTDTGYELTMYNDRLAAIIEKAIQIRPYWARYSINSYTVSGDNVLSVSTDNYSGLMQFFSQGNVLFMAEVIAAGRYEIGNTGKDLDIGILPSPKFEKNQEYYTPVRNIAAITCVPYNVPDTEKTSVIIEYWASESHKTLKPAYIEQLQFLRISKHSISRTVIDTIFAARTYDPGFVYSWGDLYPRLTASMYDGYTNFPSKYNMYKTKATAAIKEFVDNIPD